MLPRSPTLPAAAVLLLLPTALLRAEDAPKVQDKDLEGDWELKSVVLDGKDSPAPPGVGPVTYSFAGDVTAAAAQGKTRKGTFKADAGKSPKTIDLTAAEGDDKGKTFFGVYEAKGDELRLCIAAPGRTQPTEKDRPTELSSKAGSGWMLMTLRRLKK